MSSTITIKKEFLETLSNGTQNIVFNFTAGSTATLAVDITDSTPTSASCTITKFDKYVGDADHVDVPITITKPSGVTVTSVTCGGVSLTSAVYTLIGDVYTISKNYLKTLVAGTTSIVFNFSDSTNASVSFTIEDSTPALSSTSFLFDKYSSNPDYKDIAVTFTGSDTVASVRNGATTLAGSSYTVSGNTITILKSYLSTLSSGTSPTFTVTFTGGAEPTFTISIADSTPVGNITPTSANFDKKSGSADNTDITITIDGDTLASITYGATILVSGVDYI